MIGREVGMEGDAEQSLFGADQHAAADVQPRLAPLAADADQTSRLLEDPQRIRVTGRVAHPGRAVEARRDALEVEVVRVAGFRGRRTGFDVLAQVAVGADGNRGDSEEHGSGRDREEKRSHWREHIRRS